MTFTRFPRLLPLTEILFLVIFELVLMLVLRQSFSFCITVQLSLVAICDTASIDWKPKARLFLLFKSRLALTEDRAAVNSKNSNDSRFTFSSYAVTSHAILKGPDFLQLNIIEKYENH